MALEFLSHIKKTFLFWTFPKKIYPRSGTLLREQLVINLGSINSKHYLSHHQQQELNEIYNSLTRNNLITSTVVTCRSVSRAPQDKLHRGCTWELLDSSALPRWAQKFWRGPFQRWPVAAARWGPRGFYIPQNRAGEHFCLICFMCEIPPGMHPKWLQKRDPSVSHHMLCDVWSRWDPTFIVEGMFSGIQSLICTWIMQTFQNESKCHPECLKT